jgi:hypothetical protein
MNAVVKPDQAEGGFDESNIDFIDEAERQHYIEAKLGEHIRDFLVTVQGRYMHGRAKADVENVKNALMELDPTKPEDLLEWKRLKLKAGAAKNFIEWCADAIINGDAAYHMIDED